MAPDPESDFAARVAARCPGFVADREIRARKSEVLGGHIAERAVVAKCVKKPSAVWEWYLEREIAIYRAFGARPPGVRAPRLVASEPGLLVIEQLAGEPLAGVRRRDAALPIRVIGALLAVHDQLAAYTLSGSAIVPASPRVRAQLRERLLEDPSDPTWVRDGVRWCGRRGLFGEELAKAIERALVAYPTSAFAHGDLLLRNAIGDPDEEETVGLVDWECAGTHPRDWDLALLWTQLAGPARGFVEDAVRDSGVRWRAFLGLVAFAYARELRFLDAFPNNPGVRGVIECELATVIDRFTRA